MKQRFTTTKSCLGREAAVLLKSIPISSANYSEVWAILNAKYENKRELVDSTLKQLFSQPAVQYENVLGQPVKHWDSILVFLVTDKLDTESKKQWQLLLTSDEWPTFAQLTQFLEHRTRALASAGIVKSKTPTTSTTKWQSTGTLPCYIMIPR
ncbi:hypothetical protein PR048_001022 [Dryococelus australis]|uniref:Gag protein n=1 Tax=Dryococelus australis TaxID=614101 RepID=A0ABQ9IH54_9NEOP|nr:hypothetical protein PR048_001022 [Dryococelus australis]